MIFDLRNVEKLRLFLREDDYRFLVARIAIHHLKDKSANRAALLKEVNNILSIQSLLPISYGFLRVDEKREQL